MLFRAREVVFRAKNCVRVNCWFRPKTCFFFSGEELCSRELLVSGEELFSGELFSARSRDIFRQGKKNSSGGCRLSLWMVHAVDG